ncbi:MAG: IS21 family transposase [Deltaproteobacteria bacterium]|nr:IS21 family transposase [Deltaproteobacteria bacterium]
MAICNEVEAHRIAEVPMIRPDKVEQIQLLRAQHPRWGNRRIAQELGLARNTVRDYLRGKEALVQSRPARRALDEATVALAVALLDGAAEGNGVVVRRLLAARGIDVALRTLERALQPYRQRARAAKSATVRFETLPGEQLQIDFGQRMVSIGGAPTRVFFFVAVLGFSRRIFVRASLSSRQEEWRAGLAGAFAHFGGLPRAVLIDNDGALVVGRDRETDTARIHPGFAAFCKDWGVAVRVCHPYRPRTKGKTESGVKYVKRNGIAGQDFASFAALTAWLPQWMALADGRIHGTTHERPHERFERAEKAALQPLPSIPPAHEPRVLKRTVAASGPTLFAVPIPRATGWSRPASGPTLFAVPIPSLPPLYPSIPPSPVATPPSTQAIRGPPGTFDDDVDATPADKFDGVDDPVELDWAA